MTNLLVIAACALIWFTIGLISARYVVPVCDRVTDAAISTYNDLLIVHQIRTFGFRYTLAAYVYQAVATVSTYIVAAVAAGRKKTQSLTDRVVYAMASDLPDTSIYALTVAADDSEYAAGEYLIRDNGSWRNVYLTRHARALMGNTADVIALCPARVTDATGTTHVWHVSIA